MFNSRVKSLSWGLYHLKNTLKEEQKQLKIFDCKIAEPNIDLNSGEIRVVSNQLFIGTSSKSLEITSLQLEGKKRMGAKELLNGFDIKNFKIQ